MENYQGDLADIIRPGGGPTRGTLANTTTSSSGGTTESWQFQSSDDFSHSFLLEELDMSAGSSFFNTSNSIEDTNSVNNNNYYINHQQLEIRRSPSNNIFSRMIIDSPITSPRVLEAPCPTLISANDRMISANSSKAASCLMENTGIQISSPQNTGIKRRKGQAKRVVCIPAPAPANSRSAGEIVPSDLWAWRKYGQKPIKGSPYPRGYYRCSSSKGCSARKQVERSRSEPNMLVITYTSEHNHPWPTQRNALAGSTRTQPAKNNPPAASNNSSPITVHTPYRKEIPNIENVSSTSIDYFTGNSTFVKEEEIMEDGDELSEGFPPYDQIYRSALPESNNSDQDFFAGLGEIEGDPLKLLFYQGFSSEEVGRENINKDSDLFTFYDWAGNNNNT